eukprot:jgi/Tetstr1/421392/TSEL_000145.t1
MVKRGASKRERKQRDANSCRQKARKGLKSGAVLPGAPVSACSKEDGAPETDGATGPAATMLSTAAVLPAPVLLDETLFPGLAAGDGEDGSNALIVTAGKKQKQKAAVQEPKKLSKAQQKKLKKIQEVKEQRAARSQVLASLSQHDASKDELALLRPLVKRGQKETKREGLARALRMQRAGLELPEGFMELERNVKGPSIDAPFPGAADSDSDTGSGDSMPEGRAGIGGFSGTAAGSSEDDDSEAEQEAFIDPAAVKSAIEAARLQLGLPALGTEGEERAAALKKPLKVKTSAIILDEAHERSLNSDLLLGMLSRVVPLRRKLAEAGERGITTPEAGDHECHPAAGPADRKQALVPGQVLVFLTGQREVEHLCKQLRATFAKRPRKDETEAEDDSRRYGDESHDADADAVDDYDEMEEEEDEEEVVVLGGEGLTPAEVAEAEAAWGSTEAPRDAAGGAAPVKVLPLYGMLSKAKQDLVFGEVPDGQRLIVVATNVAETSPHHPRPTEDPVAFVSEQASAQQRAGRAGRVGPGHCYRLFSSAHFNDTFPDHTPPEIVNTPLEGVVLVMKSMGVDRVRNFPFPTAPEGEAIAAAELCLRSIMALDEAGQLTPTGRAMSSLPIPPRHARMLLEVASDERAAQRLNRFGKRVADDIEAAPEDAARPLSYAVALTAAVSVEQPFVHAGNGEAAGSRQRVREAHKVLRGSSRSDALSAMAALLAFEEADRSPAFAAASGLHFRHLQEAAALRRQLAHYLSRSRPE